MIVSLQKEIFIEQSYSKGILVGLQPTKIPKLRVSGIYFPQANKQNIHQKCMQILLI